MILNKIIEKPQVQREDLRSFFFFLIKRQMYLFELFETWQVANSGKPRTIKRQEMASRVASCILDNLDKTETAVMPNAL